MNRLPTIAYFIIIIGSAFVPYLVTSLILWDIRMSNWNVWWRLGFVLWSLAIANGVFNRIKNRE